MSDKFAEYLKNRCGSAKCPFCGHADWLFKSNSDGQIKKTRVLDQTFEDELNLALSEAVHKLTYPNQSTMGTQKPADIADNILHNVAVVECMHCGYIALFDRKKLGYLDD